MNSSDDGNASRRFYLSARIDRGAPVDALIDALASYGWECTFRWTQESSSSPDDYSRIAEAELEGIRKADVLIALLPGGFGTHAEIGAALILGKRVLIHSPDQRTLNTPYPCVFHYHPSVTLVISDPLDVHALLAAVHETPGSTGG